jgi:hypothetical protein
MRPRSANRAVSQKLIALTATTSERQVFSIKARACGPSIGSLRSIHNNAWVSSTTLNSVPGPSEIQPLSQCYVDSFRIVGTEAADHFYDERFVDRVQPPLDH